MVDSIPELRKKVQEPVRAYNDVAGLLVGDRVSIHVTRLFIQLGLSPTVGTLSMLFCGLIGSALLPFGGAFAVAGFACVFLYYVFDCVDGEVARYHHGEKLVWGFHDFLFHLYVKTAFFTCLGVWAARVSDRPWMFFFGFAALMATIFTKALYDVADVLVVRYVIQRGVEERANFVREMTEGASDAELQHDGDLPGDWKPYQFGRPASVIRAVLTNFDLSVLWFLAASIADLATGPFTIWGVACDLKTALLAFYGIVLPLDFVDRAQSYIRGQGFQREGRRLLRRAHHFRLR